MKKSFFLKNLALLEAKDPGLVFALHTMDDEKVPSMPIESWGEDLDLEKIEVLYIYGMHSLPLVKKLPRHIIFIEDDLKNLTAFLQTEDAEEILKNPSVHIAYPEFSDVWAEKFPEKHVEAAVSPSKKAGKFFQDLRLAILRKTTLTEGLFLDRLYSHIPFQNFWKNLEKIPSSFYINRMKDAFAGMPAIILGAGPSLSDEIETLKGLKEKAFIIAGGSAIAAASAAGLEPHLGVALDPNLEEYYRLKRNVCSDLPILYSTRVFPQIFATSNGPAGYLRSALGQVTDLWMEEATDLGGDFIGEKLPSESLSVTTIAAALADFLGFEKIIFCGVDLAYIGKRRYAGGVVASASIDIKALEEKKVAEDRLYEYQNVLGEKIHSNVRWIMERDALSTFAKESGRTFFNASRGLSFKHIPYKALKDISFDCCRDYQGYFHALMQENQIDFSFSHIFSLKEELKESLLRTQEKLDILAGKGSHGHKVLAEMELKEERAYQMLFYDTLHVLKKYYRMKGSSTDPWETFSLICGRYLEITCTD